MAKAARSKPKRERYRYVVEVVVETHVKVTKTAVRNAVQQNLDDGVYVDYPAWEEFVEVRSARVRKVDLD